MSIVEREIALIDTAARLEPRRRLFNRDEYYRMAETGIFQPGEKVELIEGEIWTISPQGTAHTTTIRRVENYLRKALGESLEIRTQSPVTLNDLSEPEPDVMLAQGTWEDYLHHHPYAADVLLLIEVSDATLRLDRTQKASDYAQSGIAEYWIVNVPQRVLEVYRQPLNGVYAAVAVLAETEQIAPLATPQAITLVADLFPPQERSSIA